MYYCLLSSHDDCGDGCYRLFFGSLAQISRKLRRHCYESMREAIEEEELTLEELEDEYACDLDSYHDLADSDDPAEDAIRSFDFCFSGARVRVLALTESSEELAAAFAGHSGDWRMVLPSPLTPEILARVDRDLASVDVFPSPFFLPVEA